MASNQTPQRGPESRAVTPDRLHYPSGGGFSVGTLLGVRVQVDWSLLIIFLLVMISLGSGVFPAWHPEWSPLLVWSVALAAALLFFASILAHEMSHALVGRLQGIPIRRVTLFLFGGVAHMEGEPRSPKAEFLMAIVGPLVSGAIGAVAWLLGIWLAGPALESASALDDPAAAMAAVGPLPTLLLWLGPVNVLLGLFNLVPGFPLDGGRVLRSLLWWTSGDLIAATRWAAGGGQLFAWILMGIGLWNLLVGGLGSGLWLILIGWFLNNAARTSYQRLLLQQSLEGVTVGELMFTRLERVPPRLRVQELADDHLMASDQRAFPVEADGRFLGLVCFEDVRRLPRARWATTTVEELMTPTAELVTLPPSADAQTALDQLARQDVEQIPILEPGGRLLGLVRRRDLVKWLALREVPTEPRPWQWRHASA